jgi:DNA mismatch endonuclease (patch repair protein)
LSAFDVFSPTKRSAVMSLIRGSGNRDTELKLITLLRAAKLTGWRRYFPLFGKPDFVFSKERIAIFVDGCFWHRHPGCKYCYTPKSRIEFWLPKFERNVARDRLVTRTLRNAGWRVVRIWECQLSAKAAKRTVARLERTLRAKLPGPRKVTARRMMK